MSPVGLLANPQTISVRIRLPVLLEAAIRQSAQLLTLRHNFNHGAEHLIVRLLKATDTVRHGN